MKRFSSLYGVVLAVIGVCLVAVSANAANIHVGATATGNGSGSDWNNAMGWGSISFARGNVYYIQDGSYGAKFFNTAASGSTYITIKKATAADHGTDTGWASTMGDGQAIFTAPLKFGTSYWIFDGVTRNEADWFAGGAYGFVIQSPSGNYNQSVKIGGMTSTGSYDYGGTTASYVQIKYCYVAAQVMPSVAVRSYQFDCESGSQASGLLFSRCFIQNGNNHFFLRATTGAIVEYCASSAAKNSSENHGEIYNLYYNASGAVIRYSKGFNCYDHGYVENAQGYYSGTAVAAIVMSANCSIYGNLWVNNCTTDGAVGWNGSNPANKVTNLKFYNNTIIGGSGAQGIMLETSSSGCVAYNNIWFGSTPGFQAVTHNYNAAGSSLGEANGQTITSSIFVNYAGGDYRLASATSAGTPLAAPFDTDLLGTTRGADGTWDRGAYEFGSGTTPAITVSPSLLDFGSVATNTNREMNFTVRNGGSGTLAGTATVSAPFSVIAGGTYSLGANQSQTVTVRFSPTAVGSASRSVSFAGGGGATASVSGLGASVAVLPPPSNLREP